MHGCVLSTSLSSYLNDNELSGPLPRLAELPALLEVSSLPSCHRIDRWCLRRLGGGRVRAEDHHACASAIRRLVGRWISCAFPYPGHRCCDCAGFDLRRHVCCEQFTASRNRFSGHMPPLVDVNDHFKRLELGSNELSGPLPTFDTLVWLEKLDLSNNRAGTPGAAPDQARISNAAPFGGSGDRNSGPAGNDGTHSGGWHRPSSGFSGPIPRCAQSRETQRRSKVGFFMFFGESSLETARHRQHTHHALFMETTLRGAFFLLFVCLVPRPMSFSTSKWLVYLRLDGNSLTGMLPDLRPLIHRRLRYFAANDNAITQLPSQADADHALCLLDVCMLQVGWSVWWWCLQPKSTEIALEGGWKDSVRLRWK